MNKEFKPENEMIKRCKICKDKMFRFGEWIEIPSSVLLAMIQNKDLIIIDDTCPNCCTTSAIP